MTHSLNRAETALASAVIALASLAAALGASGPAWGQGHTHDHGQTQGDPAPPGPTRITMDALHKAGGVPPGWRFTVPPGDAAAGRQAFIEFKCYACHAIAGEQFPLPPGQSASAGPELTGMGGHHPPDYFAESIMNPSAVLVEGPGYIGGDGRSIMPAYPDMTLAQLANLVAYLRTLGGSEATHGHEPVREQSVGGYRVRLVYEQAEATSHMHHDHGAGMSMGQPQGRLLVFLADAASGQPIPYVPVSARIETAGKPARTIKLAPSLGSPGFHYGAAVALPAETSRIALSIGPATVDLGPGAPPGLKQARTVVFDWK